MFNSKKTKVKGLAEWQKKIGDIPEKALADIAIRTEKRGRGLRWQAKQDVPRDTGDLYRSIDFKVENTKKSTRISIFSNLDYAADVEFGTSEQAAKPYMMPAFKKYSKKYVEEDLRISFKKAVRKK